MDFAACPHLFIAVIQQLCIVDAVYSMWTITKLLRWCCINEAAKLMNRGLCTLFAGLGGGYRQLSTFMNTGGGNGFLTLEMHTAVMEMRLIASLCVKPFFQQVLVDGIRHEVADRLFVFEQVADLARRYFNHRCLYQVDVRMTG